MQYVRTQIEDWFRIVAVVSMPQTAFKANDAGVKSSVLFLRKWSKEQTDKLVKVKKDIEARLLKDSNYILQRQTWESEIKQKQKAKADEIKESFSWSFRLRITIYFLLVKHLSGKKLGN
jgi:type I restriction enzyme M protein